MSDKFWEQDIFIKLSKQFSNFQNESILGNTKNQINQDIRESVKGDKSYEDYQFKDNMVL